ncbi:RluA family pseudouridine synthase [Sutcliffiella halmapala]|uniref:RluA family pseudouridine synthase n=1 Tax=Sutcliffiella halmapala TaxID=79882 RepID=UPI0009953B7C|nr:RluA family pseudouridine synthase [Sutcliffiella halmapala]
MFSLTYVIEQQDKGKLLREFLKEKRISKSALTEIKFYGGGLFVNDEPVTVRYLLKAGDQIVVQFPKETPSEDLQPEEIPLDIVYEDDYVLVIDKPPAIASIPSREHRSGTLANALLHYYQSKGYESTIHIVTRLDRDTSGLMLIAKHRHAHHLFSLQQREYGIKRRYEAIAHGLVQQSNGRIDAPIGRKDSSIIEREVREDGQKAITNYQVLGRSQAFTHVSLHLETGRTHQIRVHMAYLGHPLAGDNLYGGKKKDIKRQALHSCELSFYHPSAEKTFTFHSKLPKDMMGLLKKEES